MRLCSQDARPAAWLAPASFAVVRALCAPLLHSASFCPSPAHSLPTLRLPSLAGSLRQRMLSLLHSIPFPLVLKPFLLVFGFFLSLVFEHLNALLALPQYAVVLADACPLALPTRSSVAVVWALCALFLHSSSSCPFPAPPLPLLLLCCSVCRLPRTRDAFSSPRPPLSLCLSQSHPACSSPLSSSCFRASRLLPHLLHRAAPVLLTPPRPPHY
jgi:hypothetical protein